MTEVRKLEELLKPNLNCDVSVLGYNIKRLTKPGEHYGSIMLAVDVKLKTANGQEEFFNIVGKKIPNNEWLQMMFNVQYSFVKEMKFYDTVIPTLKEFQLQQGMSKIVDFFPNYFGGRINLNGSDKVDDDAVVLLENLKLSGYETAFRLEGFNFEKAKFVLRDLAIFHAIPLALKLQKPTVFEEKIRPHIQYVHMFDAGNKEMEAGMKERFEKIACDSEECIHLLDRVREGVLRGMNSFGKATYDGIFGSTIHNDFWTSNTMQKYEENEIVGNKILDFQAVTYDSIGRDVVFFLFTSVQTPVLQKYYDKLVKVYYDQFIDTLRELKCDTTPYTFEAFQKELDSAARNSEFLHCMVMLKPILTSLHDVKDLKDMTPNDITTNKVPQRQKEKGWFIIKEFAKRNWI